MIRSSFRAKNAARWLAALTCLVGNLSAAAQIKEVPVQFAKGKSSATIKATLKGDETIDYKVTAAAGQNMVAKLKPSNRSMYFNVLSPGSEEAIFIGSSAGDKFEAPLTASGTYTIRAYLMRNAARRKETSRYTLDIAITGAAKPVATAAASFAATPAVAGKGFDSKLQLQGISFRVTSSNESSINKLRIVPAGLQIDNSPIEREIDGTVTGAEVADLNVDGSPEIYVYIRSAGSGSYGSLVAFSANKCKSLSQINLPELAPGSSAAKGYMGHDEFAVVENILARRFPIYKDGDTNAKATGGMRQLQYKLHPGEAMWQLKVDRMTEF